MRAPRRLIAFAAVAALVGAACGSDDDTSDSATTDASLPRTPGRYLTSPSTKTIAGSSPPAKT